jgi:hypothetical protein
MTMPLQRAVNLQDADGMYSMLVDAHRGLSEDDSAALNARLVLLLANHIGEDAVIREAIEVAKRTPERPQE